MRLKLLLLLSGLVALPADAAPADNLTAVQGEAYTFVLDSSPLSASLLGSHAKDDQIDDPSLAEADRQAAHIVGILRKLDAIPDAELSVAQRTEKAIVRRNLADAVEASGFKQREINFGNNGGWYGFIADLPFNLRLSTPADYNNYVLRLEKVPGFAAAATDDVHP